MTTPKITFRGGPLDGQTVDKTSPGRWPNVLDAEGKSVRAQQVGQKTARGERDFYTKGGPVATTDGAMHNLYEWADAK